MLAPDHKIKYTFITAIILKVHHAMMPWNSALVICEIDQLPNLIAVRVLSSVPIASSMKSLKFQGDGRRARSAPEHPSTSNWTVVSWSTENISRSGSSRYHVGVWRSGSRRSSINSGNTVTKINKKLNCCCNSRYYYLRRTIYWQTIKPVTVTSLHSTPKLNNIAFSYYNM